MIKEEKGDKPRIPESRLIVCDKSLHTTLFNTFNKARSAGTILYAHQLRTQAINIWFIGLKLKTNRHQNFHTLTGECMARSNGVLKSHGTAL